MPRSKQPKGQSDHKPGYSFADVLVLTSATRSNLIHWTNIGIIKAAIEDTAGPGHARRFSALNVIEAELAAVINGFRVPTSTIRGALNVFNGFHREAVAVHDEMRKAPLVVDPAHLQYFHSLEHRKRVAKSAVLNETATKNERLSPELWDRAMAHVKDVARVWAQMRKGPLMQGKGDASMTHFLGLFIGGMDANLEATHARVVLDPHDLRLVIEEKAIVIDLANVVFSVGERCKRLYTTLGEW